MFVPIPDIQLPNGGEIHANSTLDAEGNHAVVLNFIFPAAFPLSVVLPTGFHICKDIKQEVPAPADPPKPWVLVECPTCDGEGVNWRAPKSGSGFGIPFPCVTCNGHKEIYVRENPIGVSAMPDGNCPGCGGACVMPEIRYSNEIVEVTCPICGGTGNVKSPALPTADPFVPSPEVRAALRCWHGGASPSVVGYPGIDFPADAITRWVASWPDEA